VPVLAPEVAQLPVGMIPQDRFRAKIQALRNRKTIRNDRDEDVPFEGETKEDFIWTCRKSYLVIERTSGNM